MTTNPTRRRGRLALRWRRGLCLAAASALAVPLAGCFGKFNATRGLHDMNQRVSQGKWQRSATFMAFNVVPLYPVAALMDALLFNPVEFWTGENPVDPEDIRTVPRNVTGAGRGDVRRTVDRR